MRIEIRSYPVVIVMLVILTAFKTNAQEITIGDDLFVFNRDINDGLSQNFILSIAQDSQGFLWLGTKDGINLYDGQNFVELGQFNTIKSPNNDYYDIQISDESSIYTRRDDGFLKFDLKTTSWSQDSILKQTQALIRLEDNREIIFSNGQIYDLSDKNMVKKTAGNCEITNYKNIAFTQNSRVNEIYLLVSDSLFAFDEKSLKCKRSLDIKSFGNDFDDLICFDNKIWLISDFGFFIEISDDFEEVKDLSYSFRDFNVTTFADIFKNDSLIYVTAERAGLFEFNISTNKWTQRMVRLKDNPQGEHEYLTQIYQIDNKIYFASTSTGLLIYDPDQVDFYKIPEIDYYNGILYDLKLPRNIIEDDRGNIWIATKGQGLWKFSPSENKTRHFSQEIYPELLRSNAIRTLRFVKGKLWIGYIGAGIDIVDIQSMKRIKSYPLQQEGFSKHVVINDLYEDKEGDVWLATEDQGIFIINTLGVKHLNQNNSILKFNRISDVKMLNNDLIFANFNGFFYKADTKTNSLEFVHTGFDPHEYSIKCMEVDVYGKIWLGTGSQGVIILDSMWRELQGLSIASGDLLSNELCIIQRDMQGHMWVASNKGLVHFSENAGKIKKVRTYLQQDGLQSNEFMTDSHLLDGQNNLWMGSINGINHWNPISMSESTTEMGIYLLKAEFGDSINERVLPNEFLGVYQKGLENISFQFNTIGFAVENRIEYDLKLEGYDEGWRSLGVRNYISYTNIPPGLYSLKIRSTNFDGIWSKEVHEWPFVIEQSISDKWWFYVFCLFAMGLISFFSMKSYSDYKVRQELMRTKNEREKIEMEMRALRAQINPHFLFNTLSSINNFILKNEKNIASQYLVKFSRLIRKILNYNFHHLIKLNDELEALELYINLEQMRLGDSFDYFINTNLDRELCEISIPPLILQPIVENAIWHGLMHKEGNQILTINIDEKDNAYLDIAVSDNGIGREEALKMNSAGKTRSYGMDITRKRLDLWLDPKKLNREELISIQDLESPSGEALGTSVRILIPINLVEPVKQEHI